MILKIQKEILIIRIKKGYTLLELIIVVVVIGILASLAMPQYMKVTERAKAAEAKAILGAIRSSQYRQMAVNGTYASSIDDLDLNISNPMYFENITVLPGGNCYDFGGKTSGCLGYVQRNAYQLGPAGQYTVSIDVDGNITFSCGSSCSYLN